MPALRARSTAAPKSFIWAPVSNLPILFSLLAKVNFWRRFLGLTVPVPLRSTRASYEPPINQTSLQLSHHSCRTKGNRREFPSSLHELAELKHECLVPPNSFQGYRVFRPQLVPSSQIHTAVYIQDMASDVAGFVTGQKDDCGGNVAGGTHAA